MVETASSRSEILLQFSRRSMFVLLFVVIVMGAVALGFTLSPEGEAGNRWQPLSWLLPVAITIVAAGLNTSLRGQRWDPSSPEVKTIMQDEWRRANIARASRAALIGVLLAQWPLALIFGFLMRLSPSRMAMTMAASTMTLGLVILISLFLYFDRE
jgi:RsiW-degrading membrane proteinase PrsW (M82 family)